MDSTVEHSEKPPQEVPVGEWVRPFANYEDIQPFTGKNGIDQYYTKTSTFKSPALGDWTVTLEWDRLNLEDLHQTPRGGQEEVLVILPNGAKVVREYELTDLQKQLETNLLDAFVSIDKYGDDPGQLDQPTEHRAVIRLATGEELKSDDIWTGDIGWNFNGVNFYKVYIPDSSNIAESIELKLEKIEGNQNG